MFQMFLRVHSCLAAACPTSDPPLEEPAEPSDPPPPQNRAFRRKPAKVERVRRRKDKCHLMATLHLMWSQMGHAIPRGRAGHTSVIPIA